MHSEAVLCLGQVFNTQVRFDALTMDSIFFIMKNKRLYAFWGFKLMVSLHLLLEFS